MAREGIATSVDIDPTTSTTRPRLGFLRRGVIGLLAWVALVASDHSPATTDHTRLETGEAMPLDRTPSRAERHLADVARALAGCAVVAALALFVFASPALASIRCGRVYVGSYHGRAKVRIVSGRATCSGARGLIHDAFTAFVTRRPKGSDPNYGLYWSVRGWRCSHGLGGSQAFCIQKRREIDGSFRSDDGWSF
jgi:hypothetical protein